MNTPAKIKICIDRLGRRYEEHPQSPLIIISIADQTLHLVEKQEITKTYSISSAKNGTGNLSGSYKTPLGVHCISEKIGHDAQLGTIFKARKNTQEVAKILTHPKDESNQDNITSRILWLKGLEDGVNRGENIDSYKRYIYIHGTDEEGHLGKAVSHGCIRMNNQDVIALFEQVPIGTLVDIINE